MPDNTALDMVAPEVKAGPALSATSDMPDVKLTPPPISAEVVDGKDTKVETKPEAEKVETEAPKGDEKTDEVVEAKEGDDDVTKKDETPAWLKALATKERNKSKAADTARIAAEAKADKLAADLSKAIESIEGLTKAQAKQVAADADKADPRPSREGFDTPDAYDTALMDWAGRRAALVAKAEAQKEFDAKLETEKAEESKKATERENREMVDAFTVRKDKFIEAHPDYDELVESESLQISIPMAQVILNDDLGPDIAYYLGQNPDEAERISKLPPIKAIAELGRISARITAKPAVPTKPAPIKPLKSGSETAVRKSASEESMEEYGQRRNREILNDKRARMGVSPLN